MGASPPSISIKPITSEADLPRCAHLADVALKPDGLHEFKTRYGSKSLYDETLGALTDALRDEQKRFRLFKAVVTAPTSESDEEVIVGFAHYRCGYVDVPKMDPFAPRRQLETLSPVADVTAVAVADTNGAATLPAIPTNVIDAKNAESGKPKPFYADPTKELSRKLGNVYITSIRGKRHVCKLGYVTQVFALVPC
jgi:hypothetical protein